MRKYKGSARAEAINVFIRHAIHSVKLKPYLHRIYFSDEVDESVIEILSNVNLAFAIFSKNFSPGWI